MIQKARLRSLYSSGSTRGWKDIDSETAEIYCFKVQMGSSSCFGILTTMDLGKVLVAFFVCVEFGTTQPTPVTVALGARDVICAL